MSEEYVNRAQIHWFPGHMMRTLRNLEKKLPLVDAVVQLLDARIPQSSLNPELQRLYRNKPRVYVLNKADLADEAVTRQWIAYLRSEGYGAVSLNSKQRGTSAAVKRTVQAELAALLERRQQKGIAGKRLRLMVTGIPNVGKSTFINNWAGSVKAKAADKPGVTRGEQWINTPDFELLDVPGVLWKRFQNQTTAVNLALIGSIPDSILNVEEVAAGLLEQMQQGYTSQLAARYKLDEASFAGDGWHLLEAIGRRRGMLIAGGEVNLERAAIMVLDEFRGGKLGRISLEMPPETSLEKAVQANDTPPEPV